MKNKILRLVLFLLFIFCGSFLFAQTGKNTSDTIEDPKITKDSGTVIIRKAMRAGKGTLPALHNQTELKPGNSQSLNRGIYPDTTNKNLHFNSEAEKPLEVNRKDCLIL
ncbi:MAG: hypothetical protein A3H98_05385 [Bacteroidetes bacterium RIFCSPLOWO2_02_FULL_36_8]|nr:MAG: hypothetical protein A3H98_05385 [Bacteroidetes bacterium RIFCSPLOWO2_02_FULL_36_8]OFY70302.1 MAG: hypothetical protein A3G23_09205 [Bacteroidetes bacterium RIFCSPLOWO2_12_FULL_37_12]